MKTKLSRILGVGLTVAIMASVLVVGTPASAGTLAPSSEFSPPVSNTDIFDMAVAKNGTTIYAVSGVDLITGPVVTGTQLIAKSTNGGTSWSAIGTVIGSGATVANLPATVTAVKKVAVAPDMADGSWVTVIATEGAAGDFVYISTDGGTTWQSAGTPSAGAILTAIDVAGPAGAAPHTIAVTSAADVWVMELGGLFGGWVNTTRGTGVSPWPVATPSTFDTATSGILAVKFSPQYAADRSFAILGFNATSVTLQFANSNGKVWNGVMFGPTAAFVGQAVVADTGVFAGDLALAPTFFGLDATTRLAYVALSGGTAVTPVPGLFRVSNTLVTRMANADLNSVALNAAGDKLVAGGYSTNDVVRLATPASAAADTGASATSNKRPAFNTAGNESLVVEFSGTSVVAAGRGAESAVSRSTNDGMTFNDVALIDVVSNSPVAFDVSADASKVYVLATDNGTGANVVSVYRKTTAWERVFVFAPNTADYAIEVAPENGDVVFIAEIGGAAASQMFYSNDGGQTSWQLRFATRPFTGIAVESASTVYAIASNTVLKSTDAGILWDVNPVQNLSFAAANIKTLSVGNVIVGGQAGNVAYSTNNTWTTIGPAVAGTTGAPAFVTASGLAAGNFIYAVRASGTPNVYRWTIGTSTAWTPMMEVGTTSFVGVPTGIAFAGGAVYVTANNADPNLAGWLYRTLIPSTVSKFSDWGVVTLTDTTTPGGPFPINPADAPLGNTSMVDALIATVTANQPRLWFFDNGSARLESFTDTLAATGPVVTAPAANFEVQINVQTGNANNLVFMWTAPAGVPAATTYNLQIALDSNFTQLVFGDPLSATYAPIAGNTAIVGATGTNGVFPFQADTTYYWRVRVNDLNNVVETPDLKFWSAFSATPRSFKIGALAPLGIQAPAPGAQNVPVKPTFVWSPVTGATTYEIVVSDDPTFKIITFSRTTDRPNFASDEQLAFGTVYYWRVRASAPATSVTQFAQGIFTTEARSATSTPTTTTPQITVTNVTPTVTVELPAPVEAIPAYLLWIIIGIGAILVIALIVLIVRTRRVS